MRRTPAREPIFSPIIISALREYTAAQFVRDLVAGAVVGVVALPLCIAFGIASGVTPTQGLVTGIIAGFIISALGGSLTQIGGPTGAFIVIVYGIVHDYGTAGLATATVVAGVLLVLMGVFRVGSLIQYIPTSVVVGFTTGIAVVIFSSQVKELLGLSGLKLPPNTFEQWIEYARHLRETNLWALFIGGFTILVNIILFNLRPRLPGAFIALLASSLFVWLSDLPVDTIATRFGSLSVTIPEPHLPSLDLSTISGLISPIIAITILGAIESLLSAVIADSMIRSRHRPNTELIAQGIANITTPLFGGIPATGAIARTATNIRNGGRTPVAGIVHSLVLLSLAYLFSPLAAEIPLPALAGILAVVAFHMSEWRRFVALLKLPLVERLALVTTCVVTICVDLTWGIGVGLLLSLFRRNVHRQTENEEQVNNLE